MFTGIIEQLAVIEGIAKVERGIRFRIGYENGSDPICPGESIAINGVCLTAEKVDTKGFWVEAVTETLSVTTLSYLRTGDAINLERSLKVGDRIGGHFVYGHVDGVSTVQKIQRTLKDHVLTLTIPKGSEAYIVEKGSVAIDGVSLTVQQVQEATFTIAVIPHTAAVTALGARREGDRVNLEADMLAKYAQKGRMNSLDFPFSIDSLREEGF